MGRTRYLPNLLQAAAVRLHVILAAMKRRGDRFFTEGINNTLLHVYISQPSDERVPGINASFSSEFNRLNTWYPQLDLFTSYLKRVNYMLQQGVNVADVALLHR